MTVAADLVGSVMYANWRFCWHVPTWGTAAGLIITAASYRSGRGAPWQPVLLRGMQPFVLVPYHPIGPYFKDGLNPQGGGVPYTPIRHDAPNVGWVAPASGPPYNVVVTENVPATPLNPAKAVIWAKFQVSNYQYIHKWEFHADGKIEAGVGLGGPLLPAHRERSHIHHFYFLLDFSLGQPGNQVVERQGHGGFFDLIVVDAWDTLPRETKDKFDPSRYTRWRIRHKSQKNKNGQPISYEIEPGSADGPDRSKSTGDFWVVRKDPNQIGAEVGTTDRVLHEVYGSGRSIVGRDVIIWYVLREHHRPIWQGEETDTFPYQFMHFTIKPRDFLDGTPTGLYDTTPPSP